LPDINNQVFKLNNNKKKNDNDNDNDSKMVLSSWQSHCDSSPGSFDECKTAPISG